MPLLYEIRLSKRYETVGRFLAKPLEGTPAALVGLEQREVGNEGNVGLVGSGKRIALTTQPTSGTTGIRLADAPARGLKHARYSVANRIVGSEDFLSRHATSRPSPKSALPA